MFIIKIRRVVYLCEETMGLVTREEPVGTSGANSVLLLNLRGGNSGDSSVIHFIVLIKLSWYDLAPFYICIVFHNKEYLKKKGNIKLYDKEYRTSAYVPFHLFHIIF